MSVLAEKWEEGYVNILYFIVFQTSFSIYSAVFFVFGSFLYLSTLQQQMEVDSEVMPVLSSTPGNNRDEMSTGLWGLRLESNLLLKVLPFGVIFSSAIGILLNLVILDLNPRLPQKTSLNKWMKFLAIWDLVLNTVVLALCLLFLLWEEVVNENDVICRIFRYLSTSTALTSSAHLVAMAVDRAVNITFPNWHHSMEFEKMNWKISILITLFNFATNILNLFLPGVENGKCASLSFNGKLPGPLLAHQIFLRLVFIFGHFGGIISATAVFIYKLRKLRTVDLTGVKSEANEVVSKVKNSRHMNNICKTEKQDPIQPRDIRSPEERNQVRKRKQVVKDKVLSGKKRVLNPAEPPAAERSDHLSMDDIIQILSDEQDVPVEAVSLNQMIQMLGEDQPAYNRRPLTLEDLRASCDQTNLGSDAPFTMEKIILMIAESHPDPRKLLTIEEIIQALSEYQNKSDFMIQNKKFPDIHQNKDRPGCSKISSDAPNQRQEESFGDTNTDGRSSRVVNLTQDDLTAIRTVKWICLWYIFCFVLCLFCSLSIKWYQRKRFRRKRPRLYKT